MSMMGNNPMMQQIQNNPMMQKIMKNSPAGGGNNMNNPMNNMDGMMGKGMMGGMMQNAPMMDAVGPMMGGQ
jgi:hypothetical protein